MQALTNVLPGAREGKAGDAEARLVIRHWAASVKQLSNRAAISLLFDVQTWQEDIGILQTEQLIDGSCWETW